MNYTDFQKQIKITRKSICQDYFEHHQDAIRIKKEETVIRNLEKIFNAALKISNTKGFQAMSMRDLARETGLSTGALYAYFTSKNDLLNKMQSHRRNTVMQIMDTCLDPASDPLEQLITMIKVHLYLSEAMQPWFYFSYMESKNMSRAQRDKLVEGSLATENFIADIIRKGQATGAFKDHDADISAGMIKALLQDWYLKHKKHARRKITVDQYADLVQQIMIPFLIKNEH